ncbi:hypothetical protein CCY99_07605 [Helicobacter sp. 16-1353]|uniref:type II secretion system protein n=1 Tax=Helicobacter sp. 16-1353 TaxID=2004996 RepID=UPI000DCB7D41|nr:prepilin-type N-terminal cleavage/methylation domain-containing protein [Helicobacter sp. 16-1353]RAX52248.1 hypothetical protein CCY99_07605 [Helicobacter sp. 16-1353]
MENKRNGFSMIELVFVIVILGVLAAVAVPRFVTTRTDAQVAMARSDIASVLKAIPARVFAENLDPTAARPDGFSSWADWMIDTGGLDRGRWEARTNQLGPLGNVNRSGSAVTNFCGPIIQLDTNTGDLTFDPNQIANASGNTSTFCTNLKNSYPSNSNRVIPLATTGAVKF